MPTYAAKPIMARRFLRFPSVLPIRTLPRYLPLQSQHGGRWEVFEPSREGIGAEQGGCRGIRIWFISSPMLRHRARERCVAGQGMQAASWHGWLAVCGDASRRRRDLGQAGTCSPPTPSNGPSCASTAREMTPHAAHATARPVAGPAPATGRRRRGEVSLTLQSRLTRCIAAAPHHFPTLAAAWRTVCK